MTPKLLRRISAGLALVVALAGCGSDDSSSGGSGSGGASAGGASSGGASAGGTTSGGGSGGVASGGAGSGGVASGGAAGTGGSLDAGSDAPVDPGPYPAGPYGNNVGDTIANLAWEGYVNTTGAVASNTLPYVSYSTDEMRKSGKAYGLIHISAFT